MRPPAPQRSECQSEEFNQAWVNGKSNYDSLKVYRLALVDIKAFESQPCTIACPPPFALRPAPAGCASDGCGFRNGRPTIGGPYRARS